MKPPRFAYHAPRTLEEALGLVADTTEETSVLAGGQSLVPLLNMRLARPAVVVDLNGVEGLAGCEAVEGSVRIGAMTRQRTLELDPLVRSRLPLLTEAARHVAHVAIRTRGTIGGSLAHADPAAELPATAVALGARLLVRGTNGARTVPAAAFFLGPLMTSLEAGELLVAIEAPVPPTGTGHAFIEISRAHGAFALVGAAALLHTGPDGLIDRAGLALCGVGGVPYAPAWLEELLVGRPPEAPTFAEAGERIRDEVRPPTDVHAGSDYRRRAAGVVAARALAAAARTAGREAT